MQKFFYFVYCLMLWACVQFNAFLDVKTKMNAPLTLKSIFLILIPVLERQNI